MVVKEFAALPLIVLLPAASALLVGLLGRRLPDRWAGVLANLGVFGSFGVALYAFALMWRDPQAVAYSYRCYTFLATGLLALDVSFYFDRLSAVMTLVVTGVSALIHLYSIGYMKGDRSVARYFSHLNMFVFFMLLLVLGKNLLVLFVGWEGVGLSSYLLIGFWFDDMAKAVAGKKAFIVNRIGDFAFLLALLMLVIYNEGTLDFLDMERWAASGAPAVASEINMTIICLLLFGGAVGKSAQIPLFVWLPDAMAGPTPVSALIHAATMVTAGVYMVARLSFLYVHAPVAMAVVACLGAATALFAATIGLAQRDIKKVLAYSTISQLGYMFIGVGTGAFAAGIFHLTTHAFFKACLFLGAGSVIHALSGEQDIFRMGGLRKKMPVTAATFLLSTLAISGIPPLAGFFSKDEILTSALLSETRFPLLYQGIFAVGLAGAFLTAFYMMRLYWLAFQGSSRLSAPSAEHAHESPAVMTLPLVVLAGLAVVGGGLGLPGDGNLFHRWMAPVLGAYTSKVAEASAAVHWGLVAASVAAGAVGLAIAWLVYRSGPEGVAARLAAAVRPVHTLLVNKYWVDELYDLLFVRPLVALSWFLHRVVDVVFIDLLGVNLPAFAVKGAGVIPRFYHDGNVQRYLFAVVAGVAVLWAVL